MVFGDAFTKATRLVELHYAFLNNPNRALTTSELAKRLGCAPRTVRKYLSELSGSGRLPVYHDKNGWRLVENARLMVPPVTLELQEAAVLYLAARLLSRHAPEPHSAVRGAMARLSAVVPPELRAAFVNLTERAAGEIDDRYASVFRDLAYGWALSRVVSIEYRSRSSRRTSTFDLRPYLIEPSAWGSAVYAIGRADPPGEVRVFKIARIQSARLTQLTFRPPKTDELLERLDSSWGVWWSDEDPIEVVLRFSADVAARVRETRWHASQKLETLNDGGLKMSVAVMSTTDILPWVLGWGRHCEVVAPADLRERVKAEHESALSHYRG